MDFTFVEGSWRPPALAELESWRQCLLDTDVALLSSFACDIQTVAWLSPGQLPRRLGQADPADDPPLRSNGLHQWWSCLPAPGLAPGQESAAEELVLILDE